MAKVPLPTILAGRNSDLRLAIIRGIHQGSFFDRYLAGAKSMATKFGITVLVFDAEGKESMRENIQEAMRCQAHAIIVSSGSFGALRHATNAALKQNIAIVAFDMLGKHPEGVSAIEQNDILIGYMQSLQIAKDSDGVANVIYVNSGQFAPEIRRERGWRDIKWRFPELYEVCRVGNGHQQLRS